MSVREKINGDFLYYFDQGKVTDAYMGCGETTTSRNAE